MADSTNKAAAVELPELPAPVRMSADQAYLGYTTDQMRAYARAAIAAHAAALADSTEARDQRYPATNRRERAVAILIADGWKWDGTDWTRPPAALAGEAVAWRLWRTNTVTGEWMPCTEDWNNGKPEEGIAESMANSASKYRVEVAYAAPHPTSAPDVAGVDVNELRRAVSAIGVVGMIGGHDVIRRNSVLEIIDRRIAAQQETAHAKA